MADVKTASRPASQASSKPKNTNGLVINLLIVIACVVAGWLIWAFVLGSPSNFTDAEKLHPKNVLGSMHVSYIIPFLIALNLIVWVFIIERALTLGKAAGKMKGSDLVRKVQFHLANKNVDAALTECDKQGGSVGNILRSGLLKYKEMIGNSELNTDQKVLSIQNEIEEATALEMPMLDKNLVFLSTITSAATLLGLLGTVVGMIVAFNAMAQSGAPDATTLAAGISEALYNTALGIGTSFIAMIAYNYFTTRIDGLNYNIDESGFTLTQSFAANYK